MSAPHAPSNEDPLAPALTSEAPIVPIAQLRLGESGVVASIRTTRHLYLQRLTTFGVAPGRRVRLRQRQPALVVQIGETELALDHAAGHEIYVTRQASPRGGADDK